MGMVNRSIETRASLAVVGAGVAGCAVVAGLRQQGWLGSLSLWEMGRGPGGRSSARRSRQDPDLHINHGAPCFNLDSAALELAPPRLLKPLLAGGWIEPWCGVMASLGVDGSLHPPLDSPLGRGQLFQGRGGMDQLCGGLLALGDQLGPPIERHFGTLVRHLSVTPAGRWRLQDAGGQLLDEVDWLVLSSTLLAHPRALLVLGWQVIPLLEVARQLQDPQLDHALATIGSIRSVARSALLLVSGADAARHWQQLPFRLLEFDPPAQQRFGLSRLSIQPLEDGRCVVVAHSSTVVAEEHLGVYGSRSAIALQLGAGGAGEREQQLIAWLSEALQQALADHLEPGLIGAADRQLMRWGAAFPLQPGLPDALQLCAGSRIAFCGDAMAGPGFGRVEGAWRSGEALAASLLPHLQGRAPTPFPRAAPSGQNPQG